jgi:LuxR family transcriptional regulator, maltose regulon positive regulatory protein
VGVQQVSTMRPGALVPPPTARTHVARTRLDEMFDAATLDAALVLVSAPAGSGKTIAVSGWLTRRGGGAWYSLDTEDNDPAVFWPSVAAALQLDAGDVVGARSIAGALFAAPTTPVVLVLDDYHVITNPAIHRDIDQLLAEAPAALRLVIVTRHDPPLALPRLRAHSALAEIRYDELRFDRDDVAAVLDSTAGVTLPAGQLQRLVERIEGWAAAVQLVGISTRDRDDPAAVVDAFTGDNRYLFDYFRDEVITQLPTALRSFLLGTAILDRLTASLCEAVTGSSGAQGHLEELERRNLFLLPLDHRRHWYRYHHLFAEWLRLQIGDQASRHAAAADWLLDNGFTADAVRHLISAGESERAADVVEQQRWVLLGRGRDRTLHDWVQQLPADVMRRKPGLTLAAAWAAHHDGQWDSVRQLAASVEPTDSLMQAEVLVLEAVRLVAIGEPVEALATVRSALPLVATDEPRARTSLLLLQGRCLLAGDELDAAAESFTAAADLAAPYALSIVALIAQSHLAEIHRLSGRTAEATATARAALRLAEEAGLAEHPEAAVANLTLADLLLAEGRRDDAERLVAHGKQLVARVPHVPREQQARAVRERLHRLPVRRTVPGMVEALTGRELSVLRLLPTTLTPRQIAGELYVSLNTIKTHTRSLYRKLGVSSRHEAIEAARRMDLL